MVLKVGFKIKDRGRYERGIAKVPTCEFTKTITKVEMGRCNILFGCKVVMIRLSLIIIVDDFRQELKCILDSSV